MRRIHPLLALILIFLFAASPAFALPQLRVVGSWSNLTAYLNLEEPFWTKKLPEALGGKTEVIMTSLGQVNLSGAAVLRAMDQSLFDVVHTVADYVVSDCPELAGLDLPALAPDIETARKVVEAYRPVLEKTLEGCFNAKLLTIMPYPAQVLFSNEKIGSLEDLKGKKIRASGWTTAEFIEALGATGVNLAFSEVPQSLQRGVVDGAVTGSLSGFNAGWGEVAKYLYPLPIGGWDYIIGVMRLDTWKALSPEEQQTLTSLIQKELEIPGWNATERETQLGIACLTGQGECPGKTPAALELIPVAPGDLELARKILVERVLPAWAQKAGPEAVARWESTIGAVTGLKAK